MENCKQISNKHYQQHHSLNKKMKLITWQVTTSYKKLQEMIAISMTSHKNLKIKAKIYLMVIMIMIIIIIIIIIMIIIIIIIIIMIITIIIITIEQNGKFN